MKKSREIKIGILATVCVFLLIFGFNYLKGVNIFTSVRDYHGKFVNVNGLQEQSPVYVKGYKIGLVKSIRYDFTQDTSFTVDISIDKSIKIPKGAQMALISDGLLSGTAVELIIPSLVTDDLYERGDYLPTMQVPGLIERLETTLFAHVDSVVRNANALVEHLQGQLADNHIQNSLQNIDALSEDLRTTSIELKKFVRNRIPVMVDKFDTILTTFDAVSSDIREADLKQTVSRVNTMVDNANGLLTAAQSKDGTLGLLLKDKALYTNLNATVNSADSLLVDLKANPRRYVHFSLFGGKDKSKKK